MTLYRTDTYTTTGTKESWNLDPAIVPFNASVACTLVSGTVSYKLQFSLDPMSVADAAALWFDSIDIPAATATSALTLITSPQARFRVVIAAISGVLTIQSRQGLSTN